MTPYFDLCTKDGVPLRLGTRWIQSAPDPTSGSCSPGKYSIWPGHILLARHNNTVFYLCVNSAYARPGASWVDGGSLSLPLQARRHIDPVARRALREAIREAREYWKQWGAENSDKFPALYRPYLQRCSDWWRSRHRDLAHSVLIAETKLIHVACEGPYARETIVPVCVPNSTPQLPPHHKLIAYMAVDPSRLTAAGWFHRVWYRDISLSDDDHHDGFSRPRPNEEFFLADVHKLRPGVVSEEYVPPIKDEPLHPGHVQKLLVERRAYLKSVAAESRQSKR